MIKKENLSSVPCGPAKAPRRSYCLRIPRQRWIATLCLFAVLLCAGMVRLAQAEPNVIGLNATPAAVQTGQNVEFAARTDQPAALVVVQFPDLSGDVGMRMLPGPSQPAGTSWSLSLQPRKPGQLRFRAISYSQDGRAGRAMEGSLQVSGSPLPPSRRTQGIFDDAGKFFVGVGSAIGSGINTVGSAIGSAAGSAVQAVTNFFTPPPPPQTPLPSPPPRLDPPPQVVKAVPLNNANPLSNVTPLKEVSISPNADFLGAGALVGNSGGALIGNAGAGLIGNAGAGFTMPIGNNLTQVSPAASRQVFSTGQDRNKAQEAGVNSMFQKCFGRGPSPAELSQWINKADFLTDAGCREVIKNPNAGAIRDSMTKRAIAAVRRQPPVNREEEAKLLGSLAQNGWTYDELVNRVKSLPVSPLIGVPPGSPTGAFSPANAKPGDPVTLSGQAKPGSSMSAYFNGQTHVGVAKVDQSGRYSLTFTVPAGASPGSAYVAAGCDSCGNGWNNFRGLTVTAAAAVPGRPTGAFTPAGCRVGNAVTLSGQAKPGSFMSVYFNGKIHVGVAKVDQSGRYNLTFNVPAGIQPGNAFVAAGCDSCGNGWNTFQGLTVYP